MKRILIGATSIVAGIIGVAGSTPALAETPSPNLGVCQPQSSHITPPENTKEVTVTAPEGKLISGYCVKAGSINQGLGPEYEEVEPPAPSVAIRYGLADKDISHYVVFYVDAVTPVKPTSTAPTCDAEGTVEQLANTDAYTYTYTPGDGVMTVSVKPKEGFFLSGDTGPWTYPIAKLTTKPDGKPCVTQPEVESDPPVTPTSPPVTPTSPGVPPVAPTDRPPTLSAAPTAVAAAGPVPAQPVVTQLPATGTSSWWLATVAMGLVLAGSGLVTFGRRPS